MFVAHSSSGEVAAGEAAGGFHPMVGVEVPDLVAVLDAAADRHPRTVEGDRRGLELVLDRYRDRRSDSNPGSDVVQVGPPLTTQGEDQRAVGGAVDVLDESEAAVEGPDRFERVEVVVGEVATGRHEEQLIGDGDESAALARAGDRAECLAARPVEDGHAVG